MAVGRSVCAVLAFLCLWTGVAWAQTSEIFRQQSNAMRDNEFEAVRGVPIGEASALKITVSQEARYDSNIFLTADNEKHDFISVTKPRILLETPASATQSDHLLQLLYGADIGSFSDYKSQNYVNQDARAKANFSLPFGYFHLQNEFRDTIDRASTEFTSQVRRAENLTQTALGVEFNKLIVEAGYSHFLRDYHEDIRSNLNYNEDFYSATAYYQLFPKTKVLAEYDHGVIDYDDDPARQGDYDQFRFGFKRDLTEKTAGTLKLGYQKREYEQGVHSDFEGFVSTAEISTALTDRTRLRFNYLKTAIESVDINNNFYDLNGIGLHLTQGLSGHLSLSLSSRLEVRDYPQQDPLAGKERRDSVITEGLTVSYRVKEWGRVDLGYEYLEDFANIDSNSYRDHTVSLRFDLLI